MLNAVRRVASQIPFARAVYRRLRPVATAAPPLAIQTHEVMRFRRYAAFELYVAPLLDDRDRAELVVPELAAPVPLVASVRPDIPNATRLTAEILMPRPERRSTTPGWSSTPRPGRTTTARSTGISPRTRGRS